MDKIKSMFLQFVKPLILAHVSDLSMLVPVLVPVITGKTNLSSDQATALASSLVDLVETELAALINKL